MASSSGSARSLGCLAKEAKESEASDRERGCLSGSLKPVLFEFPFIILFLFAYLGSIISHMENKTLYGEDDGLLIPSDLGPWTEDKFDLIRLYCQIFSSSMKNKWPTRVYIDLY